MTRGFRDTVTVARVKPRLTTKHMVHIGLTVYIWLRSWVGVTVRVGWYTIGRLGTITTSVNIGHLESGRALAACNVPQPCRLIRRAGRQCLSVGAKCNTGDSRRVSLEDTTLGLRFV